MSQEKSGIASRRLALSLLEAVLVEGQAIDEALDDAETPGMDGRDRAFAHAIAGSVLRRKGEAEAILRQLVPKPLPKSSGTAHLILLSAIAQLQFLKAPAHAVIDVSVALAQEDFRARHFAKLINAVLRKAADTGDEILAGESVARLNTPSWLMKSWVRSYGDETANRIAASHLAEADVDLSVKADAGLWAADLGGTELPTGSIRLAEAGPIDQLPGFNEGAWWVQDAAAALPVLLLGDVRDKTVLDLCAAPGGKTAQLAARGARVTAVDSSSPRLRRLKENLDRLGLQAELRQDDVFSLPPENSFDIVLLDAPCSATGTIRRHPDLPYRKSARQIQELAALQTRMLDHVAFMVKPGGTLLFCTCSLQPQEGEDQATGFLERQPAFSRAPVSPEEIGNQVQFIDGKGDLRTLPFMSIAGMPGVDGFFTARFRRGA